MRIAERITKGYENFSEYLMRMKFSFIDFHKMVLSGSLHLVNVNVIFMA